VSHIAPPSIRCHLTPTLARHGSAQARDYPVNNVTNWGLDGDVREFLCNGAPAKACYDLFGVFTDDVADKNKVPQCDKDKRCAVSTCSPDRAAYGYVPLKGSSGVGRACAMPCKSQKDCDDKFFGGESALCTGSAYCRVEACKKVRKIIVCTELV
jgi:hypothetical protein